MYMERPTSIVVVPWAELTSTELLNFIHPEHQDFAIAAFYLLRVGSREMECTQNETPNLGTRQDWASGMPTSEVWSGQIIRSSDANCPASNFGRRAKTVYM
jgi:hypothetical protein